MTSAAIERKFTMMVTGSILIMTGILAFLAGSIGAGRQNAVLEQTSIHTSAAARRHVPLSPMVAGLVVVGGIVLFVVPRRPRA